MMGMLENKLLVDPIAIHLCVQYIEFNVTWAILKSIFFLKSYKVFSLIPPNLQVKLAFCGIDLNLFVCG